MPVKTSLSRSKQTGVLHLKPVSNLTNSFGDGAGTALLLSVPLQRSPMADRSDIAPETLQVTLDPEGVEVEYLDGRSVFYHGVPKKRAENVVCPPGRDVHVLVASPNGTEGVMVYVNDRTTHDDILESTGVGRVILERGERTSLFPGVEAENHGYRIEVTADPETTRGRVFVFAEDETGEAAYELVAAGDGDDDSHGEATERSD
jgi:hypothetical protein